MCGVTMDETLTRHIRVSADDLTPFKKLMELVADELKQQSSLANEVFPEKMDAFYLFADRVFEDVVKKMPLFLKKKIIPFNNEFLDCRVCRTTIRKSHGI